MTLNGKCNIFDGYFDRCCCGSVLWFGYDGGVSIDGSLVLVSLKDIILPTEVIPQTSTKVSSGSLFLFLYVWL